MRHSRRVVKETSVRSDHYFLRLMQVSNQISRHDIRGILNDPKVLIEKLGGDGDMLTVAGSQYDIEDLIRLARSQANNRILDVAAIDRRAHCRCHLKCSFAIDQRSAPAQLQQSTEAVL